ncbi:MAG: HNH endonuclease [Candidatus Sumerlaeia bacterium]|nr:HNH endonuclease [Candidatus Sumerlaeia bacterium]
MPTTRNGDFAMRCWIYGWRFDELGANAGSEGLPTDLSFGTSFRKRGVAIGDRVYIVANGHGELYLAGRFEVQRIAVGREQFREVLGEEFESAYGQEMIYGGDTGTPLSLGRRIDSALLRDLHFGGPGAEKPLVFNPNGKLDPQTIRGLRELPPETAEFFDRVLAASDHRVAPGEDFLLDAAMLGAQPGAKSAATADVEDDSEATSELFLEGRELQRITRSRQRSEEARRRCIELKGLDCAICGFNFKNAYGELGEGFIEVHHLRPIAEAGPGREVDPIKDLVPLCSNCHRMVHRGNECRDLEELRRAYLESKGREREDR